MTQEQLMILIKMVIAKKFNSKSAFKEALRESNMEYKKSSESSKETQ